VRDRIAARTLLARIAAGAAPVILDVRSAREFADGHVPGAVHVPFWAVGTRIEAIAADKDEELVVYCGHGPRAMIAGRTLRRRGFTRLLFLDGHFSKWRSAGLREERT
jgi:rhodanese-related sulfurtransferase